MRPLPTISRTRSSRSVSPMPRSATLVPSYITAMRSQTRKRSCSRWVIRTTRHAAALTPVDQVEHRLDLGHGECRGRLVHDQDARLEGGGARDSDRLALAAGELLDLAAEAAGYGSRALPACARASALHPPPVEETAAGGSRPRNRLPATSIVVAEAEVLVDHLDAGGARIRRAGEARPARRRGSIVPASGR